MRIPLELLRIVIIQAEIQLTWIELLQLRLVNSIFDQEILSRLFSDKRPADEPRFINANVWSAVPQSLREKYLRFRLRRKSAEPSLFAYLFVPVYERRLADLGLEEDKEVEREEVLNQLLRFVTHNRQTASAIAHKSNNTSDMINGMFRSKKAKDGDGRKEGLLENNDLIRQEQIQEDYEFVEFCHTVANNHPDTIKMFEPAEKLRRYSICFGTTMFEFCIRYGNVELLRRIVEKEPSLICDKKTRYTLFAGAAERSDSAREAVSLLLEFSTDLQDTMKRRRLLEYLSWKAGEHGHLALIQGILDWLGENWRPNACVFPLPNTSSNLAAPETFTLWFNDHKCRHYLLQRAYANILRARPFPSDEHRMFHDGKARSRATKPPKPDISLLQFLLHNGVDVDNCWPNPGNAGCRYHIPPLFMAVWRGYADWAEVILQAGARTWTPGGRPLMLYAEAGGIIEEVKAAVEKCGHTVDGIWIQERGSERSTERSV
ncbi:hypothetical protein N0V90_006909 [Kalmusia sp. IMI 367209]|nr:hypothetical protein N0V90_006909 [Kalmusia sp. IMI 367209]